MSTSRLARARARYEQIGEDFNTALTFHMEHGYVIATPEVFAMGHTIEYQGGMAWFIEYLEGSIVRAVELLPFYLPFIVAVRKGKPKAYATAKLVNRFLKDGSADAMQPRGVWWQNSSSAETASSFNGG